MSTVLELPRPPAVKERICRFTTGDVVDVVRGGFKLPGCTILEMQSDPVDVPGYSHCAGKSARYRITGYDHWVYDWMLERSTSVS